jgi:uncharacterized membrane protein
MKDLGILRQRCRPARFVLTQTAPIDKLLPQLKASGPPVQQTSLSKGDEARLCYAFGGEEIETQVRTHRRRALESLLASASAPATLR